MGLSTSERTQLATTYASHAAFFSLHSADPGDTGANELAGGSPAYARAAVPWGTPASGAVATAAATSLNVPGGATVAYVGYWTAATGGRWVGSDVLTTPEVYGAQGTYVVDSVTHTENA